MWPKEWHDQVTAVFPAPNRQGLAKIFVISRYTRLAGHVEKAQQANRGVDQKATGNDKGFFEFTLQNQVDKVDWIGQVAKEISHAALWAIRHDLVISGCYWPKNCTVKTLIKSMHLAVVRL